MLQKSPKLKRDIWISIVLIIVLVSAVAGTVYLTSGDFIVSISSSSGIVVQGDTTQTAIFIKYLGGNNVTVALSGDAGSSGIECSLDPSTKNPDFTSTLTMSVPKSTVSKNYSVIVTATGGLTTHTVSYNLSVLNADVNVSGKVVIKDTWRSLSKIEFVDKQTDLNYTGSLGDSWLEGDSYDNGSRNVFYSVTLQNQHNYTVVCHVDGIFNWGQVFNGGDLSINAAVGSASMAKDFSFF